MPEEEGYKKTQTLDIQVCHGQVQNLMDWTGYGPEDQSWETAEDVHALVLV